MFGSRTTPNTTYTYTIHIKKRDDEHTLDTLNLYPHSLNLMLDETVRLCDGFKIDFDCDVIYFETFWLYG